MKTIQKMYKHLDWANQCILEKLQSLEDKKQNVIRLFSHILFAEKVWMTRIQGLDSSQLPLWLDVSLEKCKELVSQNKESYSTFLASLTEKDLDSIISYRNSTGKEFKNTLREILTHVALHGQYHRGQINLLLRSDGVEPMNVDYITFLRFYR